MVLHNLTGRKKREEEGKVETEEKLKNGNKGERVRMRGVKR